MYKIKLLAMITVLLLVLTGCSIFEEEETGYTLPNLENATIDNYKETLNSPMITFVERMENHNTIPLNQFVKYGAGLEPGDVVDYGTIVYIYFSKGPKEVKVPDTEKPEILGIEDIEVEYASDFDPYEGVTVTDNVDQDLIDRLIVTGEIDTWDITFGEQTITYTVMDRSGNMQEVERTITIIPATLDTRYTDELTLDRNYQGTDFVMDGIGIVTLDRCVDGDTAFFDSYGETVYVRFLGIDTPETKLKLDPWGKPASDFVCNTLESAQIIVLEREDQVLDNYGRYLGWVWVDGRLLNLEVVEEAYSKAKGSSDSKYFDIFNLAERKTQGTLRRIWGELDPTYDYS